jgi:hypothetical protein
MFFKQIFALLIINVLIFSCSKGLDEWTSKDLLLAYLKDNKNVLAFGKVDIKSILEKTDYRSIPKVNVLLIEEMKQYESALALDQGVYFAIEGSLSQINKNAIGLGFVRVKNADSLANKIGSLGLMMTDVKGMKFVQNNDVSIGIKNQMAIFYTKSGSYDGKVALEKAFKQCEKALITGKPVEILNQEGDILVAINYENILNSSEDMMTNLSKSKIKEIKALMTDSYYYGTISFEKGRAVLEAKSMLSAEMMNRMMMKEDPTASILEKLGKGKARFGIAMNMDVLKYDNFINDFYPEAMNQISQLNFQLQMALASLGDKPFSALLNGKLGAVLVGEAISDGSFVPEINFHVGLGNKGKIISEMLGAFTMGQKPNAKGFVSLNGMAVKFSENELTGYSEKTTNYDKLIIPDFAKNFGKKGISGFVDLDGLDLKSLDLDDGAKFIYAIKNIYFEGENEGVKMIISGKNANENMLKQMVDVYVNDIKQKIGLFN